MRWYLLLLLLGGFGGSVQAQAEPSMVTDTATLSFMRWRLADIQHRRHYRTALYAYSIRWRDADFGTEFYQAHGFRGRLLPIQSADTAGSSGQELAADKAVWQRAGLAKPIFSLADLAAMKLLYEQDSRKCWPVLSTRIQLTKHQPESNFIILRKFTLPLFSLDGKYAILWELKTCKGHCYSAQLAIYKRTSATTWQLVPARLPGQIE